MLESSKQQITILIDSIDALRDVEDLDWLPVTLLDNVKFVLTVSSTSTGHDLANVESRVLQRLRERIGDDSCFLYLTPFTQEQWEDVLCFGGGDIYAANGALQLPESWKKSDEKISIQAKVGLKFGGIHGVLKRSCVFIVLDSLVARLAWHYQPFKHLRFTHQRASVCDSRGKVYCPHREADHVVAARFAGRTARDGNHYTY